MALRCLGASPNRSNIPISCESQRNEWKGLYVDDDLLLCDDLDEEDSALDVQPWKILVVDDDPGIHEVTNLVLACRRFDERPVVLLHASSAAEAERVLSEDGDVAMLLLDVVMESEMAGLLLVDRIRDQLNNRRTRIIIRTGQPGLLNEDDVLKRYDVNGYCLKTALTDAQLNRTCLLALRNYRDIRDACLALN